MGLNDISQWWFICLPEYKLIWNKVSEYTLNSTMLNTLLLVMVHMTMSMQHQLPIIIIVVVVVVVVVVVIQPMP